MAKIYTKGTTVVDEVLSGAERYDIKDNGGTPIESNVQINLVTSVAVAGTTINAARLNNIENGVDAIDTKVADANDLLTTGGTTTAYTLTTTGAAALATGERFRVKFNATAGATPTLNRDSKGAKSLKYYDNTGAKQACTSSNIVANLIADVVYDGTDYVVLDPAGVTGSGGGGDKYPLEARLTLETGVPISTTNQTAKTTLYLTKYKGDQVAVYDGSSAWSVIALTTDISITLASLTASLPYDVFVYSNAGTLTLELTAWTNTTTRATALTTQNGVLVKTGATTRRYVGTICITSTTGQCEDSTSQRLVWNYYNRVSRPLTAKDTTDTWTYTTATVRSSNNNTTVGVGRVAFVIGVSEDNVYARHTVLVRNTNTSVGVSAGIGLDVTNANSADIATALFTFVANLHASTESVLNRVLAAGYHFLQKTEYSEATGTSTWLGDNNNNPTTIQCGMYATIQG